MTPTSNDHRGPTRRTVLRAAAGIVGASGLATALQACGGSDGTATGTASGSGGSSAPAKLVNVEHDDRPLDNAAQKAVYAAFHRTHPNIDIRFDVIPWEQAQSKMLTLGQGNSLPNCGRMAYPSDYVAANLVLPLDDMVSATWKQRYAPEALQAYTAQGTDGKTHLYGLPWFAGATAVMVNKTLLDRAGVKLGASWTTEEFSNVCKAVTQPGKQWGVAIDGSGVGDPVQILLMAVYAHGGRWVKGDPNGTSVEALTFDSPETVAGITWYTDLYKNGSAVPSAPSDTYQQRDAHFLAGKAAIAWQGPWNITATQATFTSNGYELVSMPLPNGPAGSVSVYGGGGTGIYVSSKKQGVVPQAFEWIDFVSSDEGEKLWCKANGEIPASIAGQKDPYWASNPLYQGYLGAIPKCPNMLPVWATSLSSLLDTIIPPLLQGTLAGKLTPAQMATQVQEQVVAGLAKNGVKVPS